MKLKNPRIKKKSRLFNFHGSLISLVKCPVRLTKINFPWFTFVTFHLLFDLTSRLIRLSETKTPWYNLAAINLWFDFTQLLKRLSETKTPWFNLTAQIANSLKMSPGLDFTWSLRWKEEAMKFYHSHWIV